MDSKQPSVKIGTKSYPLKLTVAKADRLLELEQVDLLAEDASNVLTELLFDQRRLAAVLWRLCEGQADGHGISRDAFNEHLDSDTLAAGWGAVVDAVTFFIPSHRRQAFTLTLERQMAVIEQGAKAVAKVIQSDETSQSIERTVAGMASEAQAEITKTLDGSAWS